jgi:hypothetical protein
MKIVATEFIIGTVVEDIADEVELQELKPDVYYPTRDQPTSEDVLTEDDFKGYPMEEVSCWEKGKIIKKYLVIVGPYAYDLQ